MQRSICHVLPVAFAVVTAGFAVVRAATPEEIENSINLGLAWLAASQGPDGSWDDYGCDRVAITGLAVLKMEDRARELGFDDPFDPGYVYSQHIIRGLEFIVQWRHDVDITSEPLADGDGDGIGVYFADCDLENYNTGIAMMALAASGHPELYGALLQDALDWIVFAQNDPGCEPHRGGWGYLANECGWADASNGGYSSLAIGFATAAPPYGFGLTAPPFVYDELSIWVDALQNPDGGSAYLAGDQYSNILRTGNLLYEMALVGDSVDAPRVQASIDYIEKNWLLPPCEGWMDNTQAMFTMMKGLEAFNITLLDLDSDGTPEHDWFDEVSTQLVGLQMPDGSWSDPCWGWLPTASTSWALLTLERVVPPVQLIVGRMTGGGSVFTGGTRYTHGFTLRCDPTAGPNNLQINWGKGNKFHLTTLDTAWCSDDPAIDEAPPVAGFDTFVGSGTGRRNGASGALIKFRFTDAGEPGKGVDLAEFTITGQGPPIVVAGPLNKGNHQAHSD